MTTIVYDHKNNLIALDSRYTQDGLISTDAGVKWLKSDDGAFWFFAGQPCMYRRLIEIFGESDCVYDVKENPYIAAIHVKGGAVTIKSVDSSGLAYTEPQHCSTAIGSGDKFAIAALDFGCNAIDAVKYAATRDCYTGGNVLCFDIVTMKFI
jgi:hypothetical protein